MYHKPTDFHSLLLKVEFIKVADSYVASQGIQCFYSLNNGYSTEDGDRIVILKVGWQSVDKDFLAFREIAPNYVGQGSANFSEEDLVPNLMDDELYHFGYVSKNNDIHGVSEPFQIDRGPGRHLSLMMQSHHCCPLRGAIATKDEEIARLKEDNAVLRESLKLSVEAYKTHSVHNYDDAIKDLQSKIAALNDVQHKQQEDIEAMRTEMRKHKTNYKELMLEKLLAEAKLKTQETVLRRLQEAASFDIGDIKPLPPLPVVLGAKKEDK